MKRKIVGCTIISYIGKIVEFELTDRHITINDTTFAVTSSSVNQIFSYNCIFLLGDV